MLTTQPYDLFCDIDGEKHECICNKILISLSVGEVFTLEFIKLYDSYLHAADASSLHDSNLLNFKSELKYLMAEGVERSSLLFWLEKLRQNQVWSVIA